MNLCSKFVSFGPNASYSHKGGWYKSTYMWYSRIVLLYGKEAVTDFETLSDHGFLKRFFYDAYVVDLDVVNNSFCFDDATFTGRLVADDYGIYHGDFVQNMSLYSKDISFLRERIACLYGEDYVGELAISKEYNVYFDVLFPISLRNSLFQTRYSDRTGTFVNPDNSIEQVTFLSLSSFGIAKKRHDSFLRKRRASRTRKSVITKRNFSAGIRGGTFNTSNKPFGYFQ